jgi:hypothetical protein
MAFMVVFVMQGLALLVWFGLLRKELDNKKKAKVD